MAWVRFLSPSLMRPLSVGRSVVSNSLQAHGLYVACLAPLSMGFSRHGSGLPFPSPGDLLNPEVEPGSPMLEADS